MDHEARPGGADDDAAVLRALHGLLSQVEPIDFERIEPPADLWHRITSAIGVQGALAAGPVVEYRVDADDIVTTVGGAWADFARDNDAPELASPPTDRSLWSYFDRDEVRDIWKLLVERVRTSQLPARVPLRCDAPAARRWFELTLTPEAGGVVHFRSSLTFEQARPLVALLDSAGARDESAPPIPLCSWCGRGLHATEWLDVEALVRRARLLERSALPPISYGICGSCRDAMAATVLVTGNDRRTSG